ncbi:MAG: hypothetical protein EZS28_047348 [Streblomastix strix]|uniref:Uncharacterized protein n=1 Tax=Streblomastix strix TaxID=222440 RepID=A0A5J4TF91_9EUKA|nr:MAG: hypothetical protein EZS28_047348 [Streblomastix strix]
MYECLGMVVNFPSQYPFASNRFNAFPCPFLSVLYLVQVIQLTYLVSVPIKTSKLAKKVILEVILVVKFTSKLVEVQVLLADKHNFTATNVLPVKLVRFAIIVQLIEVSRPTDSPTRALVTSTATGSVANTVIAIKLVLELLG